jgi:hypothetical protein
LQTKNNLFIYIDPGYLHNIGHYRNMGFNIRRESNNQSLPMWHFVSRSVPDKISQQYRLKKRFFFKANLKNIPSPAFAQEGLKLKLKIKFDQLYNYISKISFQIIVKQIISKAIACGFDRINLFMYTSNIDYYLIFKRLLSRVREPSVEITAHLSFFYLPPGAEGCTFPKEYRKYLKKVIKRCNRIDSCDSVKLYADSQRTIDLYASFLKFPITLLPIPVIPDVRSKSEKLTSKNDITIGYFGYPSKKHGYQLVKSLYERLSVSEKYENVNFIVRHNYNLIAKELAETASTFRGYHHNIKHLDGNLSFDDFNRYLLECDIILIPYSVKYYPCQTSGIFLDALFRHKDVVVPENTWMGDITKKYNCGVVFESDNLASFLLSVKKLIDKKFNRVNTNNTDSIRSFLEFHRADVLFKVLDVV